jgi:hypothetical protein
MEVTPVNRKFGAHMPGDTFKLPDAVAKVFIKKGRLAEAKQSAPVKSQSYATRDMRAAPVAYVAPEPEAAEVEEAREADASVEEVEAPYGYKADGTPRKRPGRPAASE